MSEARNIAASVHARLLNLAREREIQFNLILPRYGVERLLYRLSRSEHSSRLNSSVTNWDAPDPWR
jgi:hypothetical protein